MLLLVWRLQKTRYNQTGPSSFSIDGGGTCRRSAPSCGTSSQWGKSTPSLQQVLASVERKNSLSLFPFFHPSYFSLLTSAGTVWSDIFFRGLTSLFLRCTWYIFSAATQDLGLSSGGMVIPYSQPRRQGAQTKLAFKPYKRTHKQIQRDLFSLYYHVTFLIYGPVAVKAPVILPLPSRWTFKVSGTLSLFSILHNGNSYYQSSVGVNENITVLWTLNHLNMRTEMKCRVLSTFFYGSVTEKWQQRVTTN